MPLGVQLAYTPSGTSGAQGKVLLLLLLCTSRKDSLGREGLNHGSLRPAWRLRVKAP